MKVSTANADRSQIDLARTALRSLHTRLIGWLQTLDNTEWAVRSRCAEWSVHDVVRHLCDATLKSTSLLQGARPEDVGTDAVDPRTTPIDWLNRSAAERPSDTVDVFETASAGLLAEVDRLAREDTDRIVSWVYGPVPWSTLVLHVAWDGWVHERDILIPLTRRQESTAGESSAAAAYGVLMASLPALVTGQSFDERLVLSGLGGGTFRAEARAGPDHGPQLSMAGYPGSGRVTVAVDSDDDGGGAEPLRGDLGEVVDSLVGRDRDLNDVLRGPPERVERLAVLREFMLGPLPEGA